MLIIAINNVYRAAGIPGSPGLACDDGKRMVHQENKDKTENKDKMVNKDLPVIKDYLEIPHLSHSPLKENKGNLDLKKRKEIKDIKGYLDILNKKENSAKIIMDIMESQVNQVIQEYLE